MARDREDRVRDIVVIGGSSTGLLAASALSGAGRHVTIVERDRFPDKPQPRSGVPQGRQAHVFLYRGLLAAEELLPGLREDLLGAGAVAVNGGQLLWLSDQGWLPNRDAGFELLSATRPLLEHVLRQRTLALPHVSALDNTRVTGLARTQRQWEVLLGDGTRLTADLVVDASGRGSRLPHWLADHGVTAPPASVIDAHVGYATRIYRDAPAVLADCAGIAVAASPQSPIGGLALPAEQGRWMVSAIGFGDQRPPRDNEAFEQFLRELPDPVLGDLVARSTPVSDVHVYRQTSNVRHPYEKVLDWPAGVVAAGDALCAFDPIYGQGITVGALQALLLRRAAERGLRPSGAGRLQRQLAASVATPWSIATSADASFPTSDLQQTRFQRILGAWSAELTRLAIHGDRRADETMSRVYNLLDPPVALVHPALVAAALRSRITGQGRAVRRPAVLDELARGGPQLALEQSAS